MKVYIALLGLLGQAAASVSTKATSSLVTLTTSTTTSSSTTSPATSPTTSPTTTTTPTTTALPTAVTVAPGGQFTAVNAAILYAQSNGIPTVTIKQGTYTESVSIQATAAVTIVGETSAGSSYANNLVTIANSGLAVNYGSASTSHLGLTWRNINFNNTDSTSTTGVVYLRGSKNAFYSCRFVCAGSVCLTGTYSAGLIANSYIDGYDKLFYSYPSLYVYGTTITATNNNALLVYNQGAVANSAQQNSTVVFDSSAVVQKTGTTNKNVFLAAANSLGGSVVVYRNTSLAGLIAATGAYADTKTATSPNTYIEFKTTGAGSYLYNSASRAGHVQWVTDSSRMAPYELASFFASAYYTVATTSTSWIDSAVMSQILADDAQQDAVAPTSTALTTSTSSTSTSTTSTTSTTSSTTSTTSATTSTVPTSSSTACVLPVSVPSTALVVGPAGSCANYTTISAAVAALPIDASTQYIYILSGTYVEQIVFPNSRTGVTTFRATASQSRRRVACSRAPAAPPFQSTQYYTKQLTFYNINFVNTYTPTTNYQAVAVSIKATKAAFYNCGIQSSQGSLLLNYGALYFSNCRIEGTTDFVWGQGAAYIYNSRIVSDGTTTGQTIAAQQYQTSVGSSFIVFDTCAVVPSSSAVPQASTYLGRDYSTSANVSFVNSYLDSHIAAVGWKIASSSAAVKFVEANNTGPGASTTSRSSLVSILSSSSAYSAAGVLGDVSWLDASAIAPFSGFPDSVYLVATSTVASSATPSATPTATAAATAIYTVAPTPMTGQYDSVMSAVAALPNDGNAYEISILAGTYNEQVWVNRTGKVTLRGATTFVNDYTENTVTISFAYGVLTSAGQDELTPVINAKKTDGSGLALYNINFENTNPQAANTAALAADFYGAAMAAYGCSFKGFQDTLLANQGVQVFSNCYIEGSVDFIWGYSKAYFHQCYIASNTAGACITAQNRPSASWAGGFVFDTCYVTYTSSYGTTSGTTYLGRPWSQYAIAVYMNSYLDKHISASGWTTWSTSSPNTGNVMFGEFNNSGPGSWISSTARASFATNLTETAAAAYSLSSWIGSTSWLDMTAYSYTPSYNLSAATTTSTAPTSTATATWAHPTNGTVPPVGAVLVSAGGTVAGSYSNLTGALASLPSDASTQIIFMYPGTYGEQVPSVSRSGPVMIVGYTDASPGSSYVGNKVTLTNARGLSVSPVPVGHSNAETATFSTASTQISMYNVDIVNSANLDGALSSYVTLAGSIYGNHIGFYGCSFIGWQDTLLTGATTGYQYYESCYIEGAIDFIWGYSKAYFKGCTIGAKRAKSAITAHSRASLSAIGGYIFDQCLFTAAPDATVDLTQLVYLGRPYNSYAQVVVKNSYLDDIIQPAGWKVWSTTSPNTDHITFAEYNNSGPGNWENNAAARVAFQNCTLLTSDTYALGTVMDSTDWIDLTYWDSIVTPAPAVVNTTTPTAGYDGTVPPAGSYIVSKTAVAGATTVYGTIQSALDAISGSSTAASSKTTAVVFIYPGTYTEHLVLNKSGTTIFMGYSSDTSDYSKNGVTISYNYGVNTQSDQSNSDSATVYATGSYFQAVNINFYNTFGTTADYASLGFAVRSSKYAGLYGCQVYGNQDALLINGYLFAYNTYVEGNVDMIWGSGAAYFLNSTIAPNEDGVSLTADKRLTNTTAAGFVFDQCHITPAKGAAMNSISLGRPWNNYARVAYIESYLGSCVEAAGWNQWSKSSPQTNGVLFGEYGNYGPGSSTAGRASFATQLTVDEAAAFELANFFAATAWINMTLVDVTPFSAAGINVTATATATTMLSTTATTFITTTITTITTTTSTKLTTAVATTKETLTATTTGPDATTTVKSTTTLNVGTTVTLPQPPVVTETESDKTTTTIAVTVSEPAVTVTDITTTTLDLGATITPALVVKTATVTSSDVSSVTKTVTLGAATSTVKATTTITSIATSTPKVSTLTVSTTITVFSTATTTAKAVSVTSISTVTVGSTGATTTTAKATTTTSTVYTTTIKTTGKTTTLSCIPTAAKFKARGDDDAFAALEILEARELAARDLEARALAYITATATTGTTTTTTTTSFTTLSTVVKTTVATIPGTTYTTTSATTKTTGKTSTIQPTTATVTVTAVSVATKYKTTTVLGSTVTVSSTATKTTGKTTTLKATTTTSTVLVTVETTSTATKSTTLPAQTTTSLKTVTKSTTTVASGSTTTKTASKSTTVKSTVTVPASTATKWKTTTVTLKPSTTVTEQSTVVKTTTSEVTKTVTNTVTTTKKGAAACTN
ncbi:carbohydrate esterase family 8 protein [Ophiostoma piceae UAMH 11346]|uniref:pectinesterase n=1 Tax=Ophiostoma piceae (strain UAMH 11346) TaxID=1262450 RepID=S3BSS1_OPHP1|nr:carbohydrate esterase family 8 protein [Ophiostoma piceae UAMH 11346]